MSGHYDPPHLVAALEDAEGLTGSGFTFIRADRSEKYFSFHDLKHEAMRRAAHFRAAGLAKGDRVALVIPEGEDFVPTFMGAVWAGLVPVPIYPPHSLGKLDGYLQTLVAILSKAQPAALVTTAKLQSVLWSALGHLQSLRRVFDAEELLAPAPEGADQRAAQVTGSDLAFLQFTSGSTSTPKGVMVTHDNLRANAWAQMRDGIDLDLSKDRGVSWLPLYHDMGLIGFVISPLMHRMPVAYIPTMSFVRNATIWLDVISKTRATVSFAPNFAYALAAKRAKPDQIAKWDLSSMRVFGCGAEPIQPATLKNFVQTFASAGLAPTALLPCYGMAEATLAISFTGVDDPLSTDIIDSERYEAAHEAQPATGASLKRQEVVNCGKTFPHHEVGAFDVEGRRLGDRQVGELWVRGPSVSPGYFQDPAATAASFAEGWLKTGDYGYLVSGDIYITGRKKDLIIINGRNYDPQRMEWLVDELPEARKGSAVAFSRPGPTSEELVIALEARGEDPAVREGLVTKVKDRVAEELQLQVAEVVLCPVGSLPKTSSGKLQRSLTRARYLDGTLGKGGKRGKGATSERLVLARHVALSLVGRARHQARRLFSRAVSSDPVSAATATPESSRKPRT